MITKIEAYNWLETFHFYHRNGICSTPLKKNERCGICDRYSTDDKYYDSITVEEKRNYDTDELKDKMEELKMKAKRIKNIYKQMVEVAF